MTADGGVIRDVAPEHLPPGKCNYARNRVISEKFKASMAEIGFKEILEYPDMISIGTIASDKEYAYHFLINREAFTQGVAPTRCVIVKLGKFTNEIIIDDPRLGFPNNHVITGVFDYNYLGEEIISYVAEGINPSILNTDNLPFPLDANNAFVNEQDVDLLKVFPNVDTPNIHLREIIDNGGVIETGSYIFFVSYQVEQGFESNYLQYSRPVYIYESSHKEDFNQIEGSLGGVVTRKAVQLSIANLDQRYERFVLSCIKFDNGVQTAYRIDDFTYDDVSKEVVITSLDKAEEIPLDRLLVDFPEFTQAKTLELSNSRLHMANLKRRKKDIGYQEYANNITVNWVFEDPVALDDWSGSYKDEVTIYDKQSFMFDEVYGLYIGFKFPDGTRTKAYHIPGRPAEQITVLGEPINENDTIETVQASSAAANTAFANDAAVNPDARYFHTRETARADGTMGYWENQDEFYENGEKVRHHKFPSVAAINNWASLLGNTIYTFDGGGILPEPYDLGDTAQGDYGQRVKDNSVKRTYSLGIKLSNIEIPDELKGKVVSYEIFYAKRSLSNSTVVGQGTITHSSSAAGFDDNNFWDDNLTTQAQDTLLFYSFDTLSEKKNLLIDFVKNYGPSSYPGIYDPDTAFELTDVGHVQAISKSQYIPGGSDIPEGFRAPSFVSGGDGFWQGPTHQLTPNEALDSYQRTHSSAFAFRRNVYNQYEKQDLVSTCIAFQIDDDPDDPGDNIYEVPKLYRGDVYTTFFYPYLSPGREGTDTDNCIPRNPDIQGVICQSQKNVYLRLSSDDEELWFQKYFPKYDKAFLEYQPSYITLTNSTQNESAAVGFRLRALCWQDDPGNDDDRITLDQYKQSAAPFINESYAFNKDMSLVFADKPTEVHYPEAVAETTDYPNLIIRGDKKVQGEVYDSIRNFLINDFYELRRDRGPIIKLTDVNGELFIQTRNSLFKTISKDRLGTTASEVFLGTGDIFSNAPNELVTADKGYAGCQNQLGAIKTKQGYCFVDSYMGKIFAVGQQLSEISANGMRTWFRDNLKFWFQENYPQAKLRYDLSFAPNGIGASILYDESLNRLIVSKKDYQLRNTAQLSLLTYEELLNNPGQVVYFVKDGLLYRFNNGQLEDPDLENNPEFINRSWTWSYSFDKQEWVGEHDYILEMPVSNRNYVYSWFDGKLFQHNVGDPGRYYSGRPNPFIIDLFLNAEPDKTKQLAGLSWVTRVYGADGQQAHNDKTFTSMAVYNDRQLSPRISLTPGVNIRSVKQTWKFAKFRDMAVDESQAILNPDYSLNEGNINLDNPWHEQKRFYGKYNVVRLLYRNHEKYLFYLYDVTPTQRLMT